MRTQELFNFIYERHTIYKLKYAVLPKPWTDDPILQRFRFCNVYRELDKVTVWIRENWREPRIDDPHLWFAMLVARMYNLPTTLEAIGYPVPYNPSRINRTVNKLQRAGETVFSGAYMVRCDYQQAGKTKTDYLIEKVFTPAWKRRAEFDLRKIKTCSELHFKLTELYGVGSFMAAQIVADTKFGFYLSKAEDWWTFAAPGPGSLRGMNRVFDYGIKQAWAESEWKASLGELQIAIDKLIQQAKMPRISAQDLQNCLCEFDKYERVRLGEGRPKQLYPGI